MESSHREHQEGIHDGIELLHEQWHKMETPMLTRDFPAIVKSALAARSYLRRKIWWMILEMVLNSHNIK